MGACVRWACCRGRTAPPSSQRPPHAGQRQGGAYSRCRSAGAGRGCCQVLPRWPAQQHVRGTPSVASKSCQVLFWAPHHIVPCCCAVLVLQSCGACRSHISTDSCNTGGDLKSDLARGFACFMGQPHQNIATTAICTDLSTQPVHTSRANSSTRTAAANSALPPSTSPQRPTCRTTSRLPSGQPRRRGVCQPSQ